MKNDIDISEMALMCLNNCAISTRKGSIDQWTGPDMKRLEILGLIKPFGPGYQVTEAGLAYLNLHRKKVKKL